MLMRTKIILGVAAAAGLLMLTGGSASAAPTPAPGPAPGPPSPAPKPDVPPAPPLPGVQSIYANVLGTGVRLRGGPGTNYRILGALTQNEEVKIANSNDQRQGPGATGWFAITRSNGQTGWTAADFLGNFHNDPVGPAIAGHRRWV